MRAYTHRGWPHQQRVNTAFLTRTNSHKFFPCCWWGSNLRSLNLESDALPIEPPLAVMFILCQTMPQKLMPSNMWPIPNRKWSELWSLCPPFDLTSSSTDQYQFLVQDTSLTLSLISNWQIWASFSLFHQKICVSLGLRICTRTPWIKTDQVYFFLIHSIFIKNVVIDYPIKHHVNTWVEEMWTSFQAVT